jgi:ferredoxin--NADP+ reductase
MHNLTRVTITSHQSIATNAFVLSFKRNFDFTAGQIIGLTINQAIAPRLYSICSAPDEDEVSVLYNIKPDGELTPPLAKLKAGDNLWIKFPQGKFIYDSKPAWWIATGTGIAPFRAMHRAKQNPLKLIQGSRTKEELFFRDEFELLPNYVKCCSKDNGKGIYDGRLTKYLQEFENLPKDINYYLCGSAEMVVDVRNLLIGKGVNYNHIITEIYF